jgi:ribose transport system substrate-binding protein
VVHIDGVPAAITAQNRKKGFERAVKETPGIEVLASQPGQYRRLPAVQVFENLMQRFPVIDAVVCANDDMAVGIAEALIAAGRGGGTKVVGIDGIPDATAAIAAGKVFATADFSGHDQAYLAVTAAVRHLRRQPVPKDVTLPVVIIDKANIQTFMKTPEDRAVPDWNKSTGQKV